MAKVLLLGGLGGHSGQAFAIAKFLRDERIAFDVATFPGTEKRFEGLAERIMTFPQLLMPPKRRPNPRGILSLYKILTLKKYDIVIANGSNFAVLPSLWEKLRGGTLINIETIDAVVVPNKATKFLSKFANFTVIHWEELKKHYPKAMVSGPIYEPPLYEPEDEGYVLVTAGTLGYEELFLEAIRQLSKNFKLVIQTGRVNPEKFKRDGVRAFRYVEDFHKVLAKAKAVVGVFPGTTPATATLAYNKPTVIVPNLKLRSAASLENMKPFAEKVGAVIGDLNDLEGALEKAFRTRRPRYENGAKKVVQLVLEVL